MSKNGKFSIFEVVDAVGTAIEASDARKRKLLAQAMASFERDFPTQYYWATGTKAPVLLGELMWIIERACQPAKAKPSLAPVKAPGGA